MKNNSHFLPKDFGGLKEFGENGCFWKDTVEHSTKGGVMPSVKCEGGYNLKWKLIINLFHN